MPVCQNATPWFSQEFTDYMAFYNSGINAETHDALLIVLLLAGSVSLAFAIAVFVNIAYEIAAWQKGIDKTLTCLFITLPCAGCGFSAWTYHFSASEQVALRLYHLFACRLIS